MMPVQFIKLESGDELAILPRRDYERLVATECENEEDARTVAQARAALAAGADVLIPLDVADAIADGHNAVRALRKWRGMTQVQLAAAAGLKQGYVSDMEKGRRTGTAATLNAIAGALRVPLALLVD